MVDDDGSAVSVPRNCAKALSENFNERWGDDATNLTYGGGKRRHPQGFKTVQMLSTDFDSCAKMLHGFDYDEHEVARELVVNEASQTANERSRTTGPRASGVPHLQNILNRLKRYLLPSTLAA